ncbi:hypothetical protein ACS0TY_023263 [Phlomoides rotata]
MILKHSASDSSVLQNTRQELGLLRVSVVGENTINGRRTKSHLRLVDLPGSERIGRNGVEVQFKKKADAQWFLQVYFMLDMRTNIIMVLISLLSA